MMSRNSLGTKLFSLFVSAMLVVGLIPSQAIAEMIEATNGTDEPSSEVVEATDGVEVLSAESADTDYPAFSQSVTVDDVEVTVEADPGAFSADARLSVESAPSSETESAVAPKREEGTNVAKSYTFDVKVLGVNDEELQTADGSNVKVAFRAAEVADPNLDTRVYHVAASENVADDADEAAGANEADGVTTADVLDVAVSDDVATAVSDGFSYYTVEFTYGEKQYVLAGESEVALSEILDAVGLVGEPTAAVSSAPELFGVEKVEGVWMVAAKQAFTSTETLTVTLNDVEYEIAVTDDPGTSHTVTYQVVNGTWAGGGTENKTETVADGASPAEVPTGMVAADGFTGGAWDTDPAAATINADTIFTYSFISNVTVNASTDDVIEVNTWDELRNAVEQGLAPGWVPTTAEKIQLNNDVNCATHAPRLMVSRKVTIDLNGHTMNRNRPKDEKEKDGHVIEVMDGGSLTIVDNSESKAGKITGGNTKGGGGIYVNAKGSLLFQGGTISGNNATEGGGIYVVGTLYMSGGTIAENTSDEDGGGIFVDKAGTLYFSGGVISGNTAGGDGGGISVWGKLTNLDNIIAGSGGTVENNTAQQAGGGIYVENTGSLNLSNASVSGNTSAEGGGGVHVHLKGNEGTISGCTITNNCSDDYGGGLRMVQSGATLIVKNTIISKNKAVDGGGIYVREGKVKMNGGSIVSNNALSGGGGVKVKSEAEFEATGTAIKSNVAMDQEGGGIKNYGTTTLTSCVIAENKSYDNGGGIYSDDTLTIKGDTIIGEGTPEGGEAVSGNKASEYGGGIYIGGGKTNIEGALKVSGNSSGFGSNVYLCGSNKLTCTGSLDNARIGVELENGTGTITKDFSVHNNTTTAKKRFFVAEGYNVGTKNGEAVITSNWSELEAHIEDDLSDGDSYTLTQSYAAVPSDGPIEIKGSKSVTIDLNGYTLNRNCPHKRGSGHIFEVYDGSTLTIIDKKGSGKITGGWSGYGGGIYVHEGGTLNFCGGTITGNKATERGGGVYLKEGATFNLQGGTISNNTADKRGGGVYVSKNSAISVGKSTVESVKGGPVVQENSAGIEGNNVDLPSGGRLTIANALPDDALIGVTLKDDWGIFTNGYTSKNGDKDPSRFFTSDEDFTVVKENNEASLWKDTFGETEDELPFIQRQDQIREDTDTLSSRNWMSGISGERYLNEINMPGSHDAGMYRVQQCSGRDMTSTLGSMLLYSVGANQAQTQSTFINQQLKDGSRVLDLRLTDRKKVPKQVGTLTEWYWYDDETSVYVCHGESDGSGCYLACDESDPLTIVTDPTSNLGGIDPLLDFSEVLGWVEDFLEKHPTETVILHYRPQATEDKDEHYDNVYKRVHRILQEEAVDKINQSTGEPFLYCEPGSDFFDAYTHMPQLKDCRGKIVLWSEYGGGVDVSGGFTMRGEHKLYDDDHYTDPTDHTLNPFEQIHAITDSYHRMNDGSTKLPTDANTSMDFLWHWELNCTSEDHLYVVYVGLIATGLNPVDEAKVVNQGLVGKEKLFGSQTWGEYIGWVKMDDFSAKYAEAIWRTNFFDTQQYCTVTVKSGLNEDDYPSQTYRLLKGTEITIPGNIYKRPPEGKSFRGWTGSSTSSGENPQTDKLYKEGATFEVTEDTTFTAQWLGSDQSLVQVVWKDGDNVDGLRPTSVELSVNSGGTEATNVTLTAEQDWSYVFDGAVSQITPTSVLNQYTWGESDTGNKHVLTFYHTPDKKVEVKGTVTWSDGNNADQLRPDRVTVRLLANGAEVGTKTITAEDGWKYSFGEQPQYEQGEKVEYSVAEDSIEGYTTIIVEYTILNLHYALPFSTITIRGTVEWDDCEGVLGRPEKVKVRLLANGENQAELEVKPNKNGIWSFNFGQYRVKELGGQPITYTIEADDVTGYTHVEEKLDNNRYRVMYTLDVDPSQKTPVEITKVPTACEPTYNGRYQTLVEKGSCNGGTMMYALGTNSTTGPSADAYSTALPSGVDAGTYYIWYYAKGDALHTSSEPTCVVATIAKRPVRLEGVSAEKTYNGTTITIRGVAVDGLLSGHTHNANFIAMGKSARTYQGAITSSNNVVIKSSEDEDAVDMTANYEITTTAGTLTIEPADISGANVATMLACTYTGEPLEPKPQVLYQGVKLRKDVDYTLSYTDNVEPGTAHVTITGKGNFTGTKTVDFAIKKAGYDVHFDANVPANASTTCTGSMEDESFEYDEQKALSKNEYVLPGYSFGGWNTKADGSGTPYADKAEVKSLLEMGGTVTLFAQWSAKSYTVTFKSGNAGDQPRTQEAVFDQPGTLAKYSDDAFGWSSGGKKLHGWYDNKSGLFYKDGDDFCNLCDTPSADEDLTGKTLTADWVNNGQIIVTVTKDGVPQADLADSLTLVQGSTTFTVPITYENGEYVFDPSKMTVPGGDPAQLPSGEYELQLSAIGYPPASARITYGEDHAVGVVFDYYTVSLTKDPVYADFNEVKIVGSDTNTEVVVRDGDMLNIKTTVSDGYRFESYVPVGVTPIWQDNDPSTAEQAITVRGHVDIMALVSPIDYTVTVEGGTADKTTAHVGDTVIITADEPEAGKAFVQWKHVDGVRFDNASSIATTFTMPAKDVTATAVVAPIVISGLDEQGYTYTGEAIEPDIEVSLEGVDLVLQPTDYEVSFAKNVDVGQATVTVTMASPRAGSQSATFTIKPADISEAEVTADDQTYDGTEHKPTPTVTWKGKTLVEHEDYEVTGYASNVHAGDATITVRGKGNFTGTVRGTFEIAKCPATITVDSSSKVQDDDDPAFTGTVEGLVAEGDLGKVTYKRTNDTEEPGTYKGVLDAEYTANDDYDVTVTKGDFTIKRRLTVKWLADDGSVLQTKTYGEGDEQPDYDGEEPTKAATARYTYTFTGWDEGTVDGTTTTYRPVFSQTINKGTLTFDLGGGTLDGKTGTITIEANVGDTIKLPKAPTREGYTFQYWKGSKYEAEAEYKVEGDHAFTAVWQKNTSSSTTSGKSTSSSASKSSTPSTADPTSSPAILLLAAAVAFAISRRLRAQQ